MLIIKFKTILRYLPLVLYHAVFAVIVFTNFPWSRFFIGWDALNPEFNFFLNFQRSIFASWQENYGLGTLTGHGFATQLPHTMIISILSLLFPVWAVRSVFIFLCLYLGGLGMYFLARLMFYKITVEEYQKKFLIPIEYICLLVALFYVLNLATVQMFYLPLEAFIVQFAALPWLFWIIIKLVGKTDRKNLFLFFIINLFASIQGFIPSLFIVYLVSLSLFAFVYILVNRFNKVTIKKSFAVLLLTLLINAYWLLPFGYYQVSRKDQTQNAYNNIISTEDFILKNKKYGNLENVALMKGFSFDMRELGGYVLQPWIDHYNRNEIKIIGYCLFIFVLLSALLSLVIIRHVLVKISAIIFLYFLASLATDSPLFSLFTQIMQTLSSSYYQAFRTTFTKFALGYSFLFTLFFGLGLYILLGYSYRLFKDKHINLAVFLGLFSLLIYYTFPVFKGNLLYEKLQVDMPKAYFEVMDFFKDKEDGRIADFPQDCPEGWYSYKWGYFGSGFYWYGIRQPVLARTFDVWSNYNENYYWEMVQVLRSQDFNKIDLLMQKYQVKWLVYDQNLIHCRTARGFFEYDDFIKYLEESPKYNLVKIISGGGYYPIKIYENLQVQVNTFLGIGSNLPNIGPKYNWTSNDEAYIVYQDYQTKENSLFDVYYPFRSLFTFRKQNELEFKLTDKGDYFSYQSVLPKELIDSQFVIPQIEKEEIEEIDENNLDLVKQLPPQLLYGSELINIDPLDQIRTIDITNFDNNLEVRVPKINGFFSYDSEKNDDLFNQTPKTCSQIDKGLYTHHQVEENNYKLLRLTSVDSSNCIDIDILNLTQRIGYLVTVENRNIEGKSLSLTVINKTTQKPEIDVYLPKDSKLNTFYLIIPPTQQYGLGYNLHFDNISIGRVKTVNDLGKITVNPIPYRFLTGLKIVKNPSTINNQPSTIDPKNFSVDHPNPSLYQVSFNPSTQLRTSNIAIDQFNNSTLILSQSFDKGWKAYEVKSQKSKVKSQIQKWFPFWFGEELKDHILVNNWENGWILQPTTNNLQPTTIVIVYLPQYLQYLGFFLLLFPLIYFSIRKNRYN